MNFKAAVFKQFARFFWTNLDNVTIEINGQVAFSKFSKSCI